MKKELQKRIKNIVFDSVGNPPITYTITDVSHTELKSHKSNFVDIKDVERHNKRLLNRLIEVWDII